MKDGLKSAGPPPFPAAIEPRASDWMQLAVIVPCLIAGACVFAYFAWLGLATKYAYWLDEIFSVVSGNEGVGRAIAFTFNDVHPPLYQIILAVWIGIFGDTETATRALSMSFSVASIGVLAALPRSVLGLGSIALIIAFYLPNAFFNFFAQETRSYGMLMFLSCLALNGVVRGSIPLMAAAAVLLGFTHFFGTLLGLLLAVYMFLRAPTRRQFVLSSFLGASLVAWPVAQILFSRAGDLLGGEFWIRTSAKDSVLQAISTLWQPLYVPISNSLSELVPNNLWLGAVLVLGIQTALAVLLRKGLRPTDEAEWRALVNVSGLVFAFVLSVGILSLHTPVSTARNYTVLLPFSTLILAVLVNGSLKRQGPVGLLTAFGCFFYVGTSIQLTAEKMERKINGERSLRNMMATASQVADANDLNMYHFAGDGPWTTPIYNFYIEGDGSVSALPEQSDLPDRFELVYIVEDCTRIASFLDSVSQDFEIELIEGRSPGDCLYADGVLSLRRR